MGVLQGTFVLVAGLVLFVLLLSWACKALLTRRCAEKPRRGLLWLQGWRQSPWIAQEVHASWSTLNPEWEVVALDLDSLPLYVDARAAHLIVRLSETYPAAASDVVRLSVLSRHGGVWADATMLCMRPLRDWVWDALAPTGFWAYHGRTDMPASWFLMSTHQSPLIRKWYEDCLDYWAGREVSHDYFWMDALFFQRFQTDDSFRSAWEKVPYLSCEGFGQSHMLAGRCAHAAEAYPDLVRVLNDDPPHAVKLSRHDLGATSSESKGTLTMVAVAASRKAQTLQTPLLPRSHRPQRDTSLDAMSSTSSSAPDFHHTVMVIAAYGDWEGVSRLVDLCHNHWVQPLVFDKDTFCSCVDDAVYCRPLPNTGRDFGTFVYFAARYYDHLPETMYFVSGNLTKHDRYRRVVTLLETGGAEPSELWPDKDPHDDFDFTIDEYEGQPLHNAKVRPFGEWARTHFADFESDKMYACYNGLLRTSRERVQRHPRAVFLKLLDELEEADGLEAVHFLERLARLAF